MKLKIITFLLINFIVAFISDIVLNDLSISIPIPSLKPYFKNESIIKSAGVAGITIELALFISIFIYYLIFGTKQNIIYFCIIAFFIGFIMDKLIEKYKIFGTRLDDYYKKYGSGLWGAIALLFSILISYFIQIIIVPIL